MNNKGVCITGLSPALEHALAEQIRDMPGIVITANNGAGSGAHSPDVCITGQLATAHDLRRRYPQTAIIFCTEGDETPPPGVEAVLTRPFRLGLLLSRLGAFLQNRDCQTAGAITIGPWTLKPIEKLLVASGGNHDFIRLTDKETALLLHLYHSRDHAATREELLAAVWSYGDLVTTHTLETHIWRLRQKIEDDPAQAQWLLTQEGGYRLKCT